MPVQIAWWWKIEEEFSEEMEAMGDIFGGDTGGKRKKDLHSRVTEHNILVISKYYSQMQISRLATLLDLSAEEVRFILVRVSRP